MCGIFGMVAREVSPGLLARAQRSLAHRGPDDAGTVTLQECAPEPFQVGFAHTRLSIIDLSPLGHQPMEDPATGNWIVFNGEIYNFRDLRRELEGVGNQFRSQSDTEVVLAAYRTWGEKCLLRLRGMFAFALWDNAQQRLLLARDPMGIKPLYYHRSGDTFLFASEVRTLLETGIVPRKADSTGALSYLAYGSVYEPWTIVEGVRALPAGHVLSLQRGVIQLREYWTPLQASDGPEADQASRNNGTSPQLADVMREAVLSHLVSDVPVGVFLSGGIDSSSLVAILSQNGVRPTTFSLVFKEKEFDEGPFSRQVARRFKTEHHEIPVSLDDMRAALPDALAAMDQPTMDGVNTYFVSAKTRAAGVKVALTGLGADELFAGYLNFRRVPRMERLAAGLKKLPRSARRPVSASVAALARGGDRRRKLVEWTAENSVHPYFLVRGLFGHTELETLFSGGDFPGALQNLETLESAMLAGSCTLDPINRVSYLESCCYMRNTLLRDSDFMSMAHGLELRVPFLDRPLVEACFRIPGKQKLAGRLPKSLLLASLGVELPREVVKRPKRGFTLPFERWLRGEMRPIIEDSLLRRDEAPLNGCTVRNVWSRFLAGETSWSRPWSLFVLQQWCERNL